MTTQTITTKTTTGGPRRPRAAIPTLLVPTLLSTLIMVGCLEKRITHTLYLQTDGSVVWSVEEAEVRSTEDKIADRDEEEWEYLEAVRGERHTTAEAFRVLLADELETDLLREARPFQVLTTARFADPGEVLRQVVDQLCLVADITYQEHGPERFLMVTVDIPASEAAEENCEDDNPVGDMIYDLDEDDQFRIVLEEGEFLDAVGFDIEGPVAVPQALPEDADELLELSWGLSWTVEFSKR